MKCLVFVAVALKYLFFWLPPKKTKSRPILFFDGVCGLCNGTVDFLMVAELKPRLLFSPLQSAYAERMLGKEITERLDSFVLMDESKVYMRSDSAIRVGQYLGGIWRLGVVFLIVPKGLRDCVYNWVASNRYKWFGVRESCRLPTPQERDRFITD